MIASFAFVGFGIGTSVVQADAWQDMYRLYNPNSGEHFYTANSNEKAHLQKVGWRYEGVGWVAYVKPGEDPNKPSQPDNPVDKDNNGSEPDNEPSEDIEYFDVDEVNKYLFDLVNQERERVGVKKLKWNDKLAEGAKLRANELNQVYGHIRPDGRKVRTILADINIKDNVQIDNIVKKIGIAENIANPFWEGTNEKTAIELFNSWKTSPGHYKNIIRENATEYGSYIVKDITEITGNSAIPTYFATQLFILS